MKKIVTIVGARPQFIKVAAVSRILRKQYQEILVNTGQHYDYKMAGVFFDELNIPKPDYNLGIGSASHGKQTGDMLANIEEVLLNERPDAVLVYGDTNSTLAGAIAASKLHIPVFHIEAGLRSFNKKMPEEINRILTDHVSDLLFSPTQVAVENLKNENVTKQVHLVGDVMYDAVLYNLEIAEKKYSLSQFGLKPNSYYLGTIHRAENTDSHSRLIGIIDSLLKLKDPVILPIHPRTHKILKTINLYERIQEADHIQLIEPVSYLEMLILEKYAKGIITDSGGVQKEAYFAKVPCYTLRDQTEWVETVNCGWNVLVNPKEENLNEILQNDVERNYIENLYGDGKAAEKIVMHINEFFRED
ncbi:non-hydrolyzing UDP-N-acetylglucosamine 2-epimerase [Bacillus mobilis]|uniref:non-hydrolyzing UDP-N-acetylglucosamine 2-epimerase n=1 Tax=Bacillus mobilis TaxID=2026190 RepID=UPI000A303A15|nr:UDP-N-acetylglucosamine 2-epimerase (non-hydrolyzing) [Bacillus mobilis]MCU5594422.1 UDP-N-acetylglucosamine 2-epimerase (non-hydrolyzing) [Bacillus mobilis]MCU5739492.1 UDP-N-acetylglucosamine 2-epimerase (non-hydrolyzing) [Bacillus mobilis]MCU9558179.1 UDP-N-acetylglucosamine 2-epimerase (non-hydrolyzing) [Bacillus mobilis]SMD73069.1 UDP-2,3-diacetamido-2,3-dideoxy-D-glucuronate 2-epimerase [Bacillus mobilis]HDR7514046.1 UDP-N-acetylglucosamine 2-epimerase (non-hydrolyzing) [Bacillus mobi